MSGLTGDVDDESLFIGAGANYAISKNLSISAQYIIYDTELDVLESSDNLGNRDFETGILKPSLGKPVSG